MSRYFAYMYAYVLHASTALGLNKRALDPLKLEIWQL